MLVTLLIACGALAIAVPEALSADAATSGSNAAEPLWREYPLEQTTTTAGGSARTSTTPTRGAPSPEPAPELARRMPWVPYVLAAIALVMAAAVVVRRQSRTSLPAGGAAGPPAPAERRRSSVTPERGAPRTDAEPARDTALNGHSRRESPADAQRAATARNGASANGASANGASANGASAAERNPSGTKRATAGPICQIRWLPKGRGSCFAAVITDDAGVAHTVATSPRVEWHAPTAPEQSLEAQAALRRLAKTLRDNGWRPMRTKGKDFNEPQWYARRFRYPDPAEADRSLVSERGASAS